MYQVIAARFSSAPLREIIWRKHPLVLVCKKMSSLPLMHSLGYINGSWVPAKSGKTFEVVNPSDGKVIGNVADMSAEDARDAVQAAYAALPFWRSTTPKERGALLIKWCNLINDNVTNLGILMTKENGKPLAESKGETAYATSFLEWYAGEGRRVYGELVPTVAGNRRSMVLKQPIGVAGIIIPWNFPAAMLTRKLGPALAAGCTVVVKTPEDTPFTPLALTQLAEEAGFPKGVINVLSCNRQNTAEIGKVFCEDSRVATVSFTGSTEVGRILMAQCAPQIKRVSLELGGLAPFIVFDSANLDKVVAGATFSKFRNAGQTCISSQNFFVQEGVHDKVVEMLVKLCKSMKVGDGLAEGTTVGPLINEKGIRKVEKLVEDAISKGARVLVGGSRDLDHGPLFYKPTVLVGVTEDMDVRHQEVFGPVIAVSKFKTEAEVLKLANNTDRGLAGYFFSQDISQCYRVMEALETGIVGCNEGVVSSCEVPFGGYKQSGLGREGGKWGIEEFLQIKLCTIGI